MMIAPPMARGEPRSLIGWIVPLSLALHVVAVTLLPGAKKVARMPPLPVVEIIEPPPAMPKPPPPLAPSPTVPAEAPQRTTRPIANPRATAAPPTAPAPTKEEPVAAVDFTSASFSNEGPGVAVARGAPMAPAAAIAEAPRVKEAAPIIVPAASLGRAPRAPGLDLALEKNYPLAARRMGVSGSAVLRVVVLADGHVGKVQRVSESWAGFGEACERTVRGGLWEAPLDRDGHPVGTEIKYVCKFEVRS